MRPLLLATAILLLTGCAGPVPGTPATDTPSITTRGVGTVTGTPDILTVVLGVATRAPDAAGALEDNNARAAALLEVLRGRGVADDDLRTSQLSIFPTYTPDGGIDGYEVSNQVTATLRDVAAAGALIDAAAGAAGDAVRVQQIAFSLDDDSEPRARARADAVGQARTQAEQLAEAAGERLGHVVSITELSADAPIPFAADAAAAQPASAVPIAAGTQDVSVTVEVVHAIG